MRPGLRAHEIVALLGTAASDPSLLVAARKFSDDFWRTSPPPLDLPEKLLRLVVNA